MTVSDNKQRIGIFGGSFDPPHLGHEALALAALERLSLDELWVIPAGVPVHRELTPDVDAATRLKWVSAMFEGRARVRLIDWEVEASQSVAAVDTLRRFARETGGSVPVWICGADSYATMTGWVGYPAHRELCNVAVFRRTGEPVPRIHGGWMHLQPEQWLAASATAPGHVIVVDAGLPDISATAVRELASAGKSLKGWVNERICDEVGRAYRQSR